MFLRKILTLLFVAAMVSSGLSQEEKKVISILDFKYPTIGQLKEKIEYPEDHEGKKYQYTYSAAKVHGTLNRLKGFVIEVFGGDERFVIVDRSSNDLINEERELQKMEDFLDGYVVKQGKGLGADYLVSGEFDKHSRIFSLSLYSVVEGAIKATETTDLSKQLFGLKAIKDPIVNAARRLVDREFPDEITVVEITEAKKTKAKKLLIAAGLDRGMKNKLKLDIKVKDSREIGGKSMTYLKTIGQGVIEKVEGPNFSILKIEAGEKEIKLAIDSGKEVICSFIL